MNGYSQSIVNGINKKDYSAWERFYRDFYEPLCNHSFKIVGSKEIAADIVQDTMLKLWDSNLKFDNIKSLAAYVYRAVNNNTLKFLRDKNSDDERLKQFSIINDEFSTEAFTSIITEEVFRRLKSLISDLPDDRREILLMSISGMKGQEIADELGITIHTVKKQKSRAYSFIKEHLGSDLFVKMIFFV